MPERATGNHIVLLGLMGAGKTTIGTRLADHLGRPFVDSDEAVSAATGRSAAQIAAADGVASLHVIEARVIREALRRQDPVVIAAAASVVEDEDVRTALALHTCLWFDADAATLAARQERADHRLLLNRPSAELGEMKRRRDPLYAELASARIDTATADPEEALAVAVATVGPPSRSG